MRILTLLGVAGVMVLSVKQISAQIFAVESTYNPAGTYHSVPVDTTYGWSFSVGNTPLTVTRLGYFDVGLDGLTDAHRVGIWDAAGTLILEGMVPQGSVGDSAGGYSFTLVTPAVLEANETYFIGGHSPSLSDTAIAFEPPQSYAPQITYIGASYSPLTGFASPTTLYSASHGIFGPNLQFTPLPEPHHYATVMGLGLVVYLASRRVAARKPKNEAAS